MYINIISVAGTKNVKSTQVSDLLIGQRGVNVSIITIVTKYCRLMMNDDNIITSYNTLCNACTKYYF